MDTIENLAAAVAFYFMELLPEQRQRFPIGGDNLPRISLHQEDRRRD